MIDKHVQELALANEKLQKKNQHLLDSQNFLKNILNSIADPIFVKDREHRFIHGNLALWKLIGKSESELLGKNDYDFFTKEQADIFWQKDEEVFRSGNVNINIEYLTDASGFTHMLSTKKACFKGADGTLSLVGIIRDITDSRTQSLPYTQDMFPKQQEDFEITQEFHGHVLVVEDFPPNQRLAELILESMGLTVDVAADGNEALEKLKHQTYDLIFMDCEMPEMDGYQATLEIRKNKATTHHIIVAMTANGLNENKERSLAVGMNDFISKPITIPVLNKILQKYLCTNPK